MNKLHKELFKFISLCNERKEKGIKYAELENTVSKETITWLINNHYIAHKRNAEYICYFVTNVTEKKLFSNLRILFKFVTMSHITDDIYNITYVTLYNI